MIFVKVLFCLVITLVRLNSSVLGQYQPFLPNTNPMNNFPGSNFNPMANSPLASNPLADSPLFQDVMKEVEKAIHPNNQPIIRQNQPINNLPKRFGTNNPALNNPQQEPIRSQPVTFNNNQPYPPVYQSPVYPPERGGTLNPGLNTPQYQDPRNPPRRFVNYIPVSNSPQSPIGQPGIDNYNNQPGFPQSPSRSQYNDPRYEPGKFNNYNNRPNFPQPYRTNRYQPEFFGGIPSNPQYGSLQNQPGSSTGRREFFIPKDQLPGQQSGSSDLGTPPNQQSNDTPESVIIQKTESDGPRPKSAKNRRGKVKTKKTGKSKRPGGGKRRVIRNGGQPNGFSSTTSISHPMRSTFTHSSSGTRNGQTRRNGYTRRISHRPRPQSIPSDPLRGYRIVCIFNNKHYYRNLFSPDKIDPNACTHINYEFAILDEKSYVIIPGEPSLDIQKNFYEDACNLRKRNPKLLVLISVGGWEDSTEKYSIMAADEEKRSTFVASAVSFITTHGFDGMDFAWEYPNCWKGALGINPEDKQNFVLVLKELKAAMDAIGKILSISVGAIKREIEAAYDVSEITKYVHYINVMTYDMHGPWESKTGHHTQFDVMPGDQDPFANVKAALKVWMDEGAEKKKLNMGIALYAKTFTLADPNDNYIGAPATGPGDEFMDNLEGGFALYSHMCQWLNSGNWTEKEDEKAGFYAFSGDQWACYDPPMMMVKKTKYMMEEGMGGILLKDLSGDDFQGLCYSMPFPLVFMVQYEIKHRLNYWDRHHIVKP